MILVTGGSGLVGSHLLFYLLKKEFEIKVLIRDEQSKEKIRKVFLYYTKKPEYLLVKIKWQIGDITDFVSLSDAFENVDYVYHCAAAISFNNKDRKLLNEVNIQGTSNIVNLCLKNGIKKLLHVSSIAAIAKPAKNIIITENGSLPQGKLSGYSYSKTQSELIVWRGIEEGLNAVIINPSVILGPGNWNSGSGKLFAQTFKGMKFYTKGLTGFVDVRDVSRLMIELMESDICAERFIVSAANISYKDLFCMIAKELRVKAPKYYAPPILTSLAWRLEKLMSIVLFREVTLTKYSAKASHVVQYYSSEKIMHMTDFKFTPISQTIEHTSNCLLSEQK